MLFTVFLQKIISKIINCLRSRPLPNEYIIASAIKIDGHVFVGKRHGDAGFQYMQLTGKQRCIYTQDGFITSKMRFINRKKAFRLAKKNGQFKREELACLAGSNGFTSLEELFSEDLW